MKPWGDGELVQRGNRQSVYLWGLFKNGGERDGLKCGGQLSSCKRGNELNETLRK